MAKKKKILMLVENISAPLDPRVWAEAKVLRDAGYQVSIICPKGVGRDEESYICLESIFIYRYRLPIVGNKYQAYVAEYSFSLLFTFFLSLKLLFIHNFDIIHAANPPDTFFLVGMFYRLLGKKYVFDQHDLAPEMFMVKFKGRMKLLYKFQIFLEQCSYRTSHLIITTNATQKKRAIERVGCRPDKVRVVRNGPSLHQMELVPPEPDLKRGRRFLLAYIGVMGSQDGVEYALYALHDLVYRRGRQDVSLVLMGDGDAALDLRNLASTLKLDEYINFTGWLDRKDVQRYLSVVDVGLTPDPLNGMNEYLTMLKTMEYMAVGKPVVAFDLHEARSLAQDASLYAVPNQAEDFAEKIETLLDNEELRCKMGAFGRKLIEEELGWEHSKKNLLLAYETIHSTKSKSSLSDTVLTSS